MLEKLGWRLLRSTPVRLRADGRRLPCKGVLELALPDVVVVVGFGGCEAVVVVELVVKRVSVVVVGTSCTVDGMEIGLEDESDEPGTGVVTPDGSDDDSSSVMVLSTHAGFSALNAENEELRTWTTGTWRKRALATMERGSLVSLMTAAASLVGGSPFSSYTTTVRVGSAKRARKRSLCSSTTMSQQVILPVASLRIRMEESRTLTAPQMRPTVKSENGRTSTNRGHSMSCASSSEVMRRRGDDDDDDEEEVVAREDAEGEEESVVVVVVVVVAKGGSVFVSIALISSIFGVEGVTRVRQSSGREVVCCLLCVWCWLLE